MTHSTGRPKFFCACLCAFECVIEVVEESALCVCVCVYVCVCVIMHRQPTKQAAFARWALISLLQVHDYIELLISL